LQRHTLANGDEVVVSGINRSKGIAALQCTRQMIAEGFKGRMK